MRIVRLIDQPDGADLTRDIEAIFFEASGTKSFAGDVERAAFRQRWLGRYLDGWPELVFVARDEAHDGNGAIAGYLAGSLGDPRQDARFDDIGYFDSFGQACSDYPAQLHINLAPAYRGRGVGGKLIDAFGAAARAAGAPGMHIVTAKGARNAGFYHQQGFETVAETAWGSGALVFMGRRLVA